MGNIKVPNPCTVKTKHKAKWPLQGQAAKCRHVPEWSPQYMQYGHYSTVLKDTDTCKPKEGELALGAHGALYGACSPFFT